MTSWRKSSHSGSGTDECVELARLTDVIGIRDSKAPHTGHLTLSVAVFAELIAKVKHDDLHA